MAAVLDAAGTSVVWLWSVFRGVTWRITRTPYFQQRLYRAGTWLWCRADALDPTYRPPPWGTQKKGTTL